MTKNTQYSMKPLNRVLKGLVLCLSILWPLGSALATDGPWLAVKGDEITKTLSGLNVTYEGETVITQTFHEGGSTTYVDGRPTLGKWRASETQYCSSWPPSDYWECYDLFTDSKGERIRFVSSVGQEWVARIDTESE